jgi:hypothetical protein
VVVYRLLSWKSHINIKKNRTVNDNNNNNNKSEIIISYKTSVRKPQGKRPRCRREDNIKVKMVVFWVLVPLRPDDGGSKYL